MTLQETITDFDSAFPLELEFVARRPPAHVKHDCYSSTIIEDAPTNKSSGRRQDITLAEESFVHAENITHEPFADGEVVPFFDIEKRMSRTQHLNDPIQNDEPSSQRALMTLRWPVTKPTFRTTSPRTAPTST